MRNCFLYWVSVLFVCVVMVLFVNWSSCYAISYEDIQYYVQETSILYHNNNAYQYIKSVIDNSNSENYFTNLNSTLANYRNVYIFREGVNDNYLSMYVYMNCERVNSSGMYLTGSYRQYRYNGSSWYQQNSGSALFYMPTECFKTQTEQYNSLLGMNYTYNEVESLYTTPATYVGNQGFYRLNELTFNNYLLNNKLNLDNRVVYYYKGDLYSNVSIPLGEIERNDCYHYEVYLTENRTNTDIAYIWVDYSNGNIFKSEHNKMYVNGSNMLVLKTLYLKYNEEYRVTITSYYGDIDNPTIKSIENLFIFLPNTTNISGDMILNWGSGDNISSDTIQIIENDNDNTSDIIGSLTSFTPLTSGELIANVNVTPTFSGDSAIRIDNFFVDILQNISEVFLLDDEVTLSVNLPIYNRQINIRSDFWITRNYLPQLADFIEGAWWILICMAIVYKVDVLVELYNFGDFINASNELYQTRRLL